MELPFGIVPPLSQRHCVAKKQTKTRNITNLLGGIWLILRMKVIFFVKNKKVTYIKCQEDCQLY
jgi:hypothetical protein